VFGASLVPLSQAVLLDTYPRERHGKAMAMWGVGVMVGPILGPTLGGWLTEYYNWRWVFYINLPFGMLAWLGLARLRAETPRTGPALRLLGFALLSHRHRRAADDAGSRRALDWFESGRSSSRRWWRLALYLFIAHMFTHDRPFIEPAPVQGPQLQRRPAVHLSSSASSCWPRWRCCRPSCKACWATR
jgi:DHA2 family multidrug resistance protein